MRRSKTQKVKDFITFPLRAFTIFLEDRWGLSSLASERYDYVADQLTGYCLDIGCGRNNRFINAYANGKGKGIDVYPYEGLNAEHIVKNMTCLPFEDAVFDSVTFIANANHIPKPQRNAEFSEAFRTLKPGGNIIVTMGNPLAEIIVHKIIRFYDKVFNTNIDVDHERGMADDEDYFLKDSEIIRLLTQAGFIRITKKRFGTQWGLNHLFLGWKE